MCVRVCVISTKITANNYQQNCSVEIKIYSFWLRLRFDGLLLFKLIPLFTKHK